MSLTSVTLAGRRAAERLMTDACVISKAGAGAGTFDPSTGVTADPEPVVIYAGKCRVRVPMLADRAATAGDHIWSSQDQILSVPIAATGIDVKHEVTITASQLDPDLVGQVPFVVMAVLRGSQVTARRLVIREVTS